MFSQYNTTVPKLTSMANNLDEAMFAQCPPQSKRNPGFCPKSKFMKFVESKRKKCWTGIVFWTQNIISQSNLALHLGSPRIGTLGIVKPSFCDQTRIAGLMNPCKCAALVLCIVWTLEREPAFQVPTGQHFRVPRLAAVPIWEHCVGMIVTKKLLGTSVSSSIPVCWRGCLESTGSAHSFWSFYKGTFSSQTETFHTGNWRILFEVSCQQKRRLQIGSAKALPSAPTWSEGLS